MENGGLDYMTSNEELQAADAAKAAINALLTATPKSAIVATLRKANTAAILNFSGQGAAALNEARKNVGIALSDLFHGPLKQQKIDKAKSAIENWIDRLRSA
jgi:hypothetical protein